MRIYLIAPRWDLDSVTAVDLTATGFKVPFVVTGSAGITTVAAWLPSGTDIRLCDEAVEPVDFDDPADVIGISINVSQVQRGLEIARTFRARGRKVVLGGAQVSLVPEPFRDEADCLVLGEFETVAEEFGADLMAGRLKPEYRATQADLAQSRVPRWDLYCNDRALSGVVQTSRGCPFDCNFCDVIQYLGRRQRHKPPENVIREAQALHDLGYREINLSDDNFTVYRQRTRELLTALIAWNGRDGREPVRFSTQMSIDIARDAEILDLCNRANLRHTFIGLETSSPEALEECGKRQNMRLDLVQACDRVVAAGVSVRAGIIVGFDSDDLSCFERQFAFCMALPVVSFNVNVLTAPAATPLYDEMKAAGRLVEGPVAGTTLGGAAMSNMVPLQMTREQLAEGRNWLKKALLKPENAMVRFERYASLAAAPHAEMRHGAASRDGAPRHPLQELVALLIRDPGARKVIALVRDLTVQRPELSYDLTSMLAVYLGEYASDFGFGRR